MYIFFVRQFPDIDHILPVIYKLATNGISDIVILCQNMDYDISTDFRLIFLKEEFGIKSHYSYSFHFGSYLKCFFSRLFFEFRSRFPKLGIHFFVRVHDLLYDKEWAKALLTHFGASLIVFDFHKASKFATGSLADAAGDMNVPVILMTHGVTMRLLQIETTSLFPSADFHIFPNSHKVKYFKSGGTTEAAVKILGSPRYCDEWERVYNEILKRAYPAAGLPKGTGKLKVLVFVRPRIGFHEDHPIILAISRLEFAEVVFKGRPRIKDPYHTIIGSDIPSARLVQWADVVVMSISSIALEVLWQKKTLLYLRYFAPYDVCVFDQYKACWSMDSQDELVSALGKLQENRDFRPYSQERVDRLFEDVVYVGDSSRDIMQDHADLFFAVIRQ